MTKNEIVALIAQGIEGQGSAIDLGGVLPKILNGILEAIPAPVEIPDWVKNIPVVEKLGVIDEFHANIFFNSGAIVYNDAIYVLSSNSNAIAQYLDSAQADWGCFFVLTQEYSYTGETSSISALAVYWAHDSFHIDAVEI